MASLTEFNQLPAEQFFSVSHTARTKNKFYSPHLPGRYRVLLALNVPV